MDASLLCSLLLSVILGGLLASLVVTAAAAWWALFPLVLSDADEDSVSDDRGTEGDNKTEYYWQEGRSMVTGTVIGLTRGPNQDTLVRVVLDDGRETRVFRVSEVVKRKPIQITLGDRMAWGDDVAVQWRPVNGEVLPRPLGLLSRVMVDVPVLDASPIPRKGS